MGEPTTATMGNVFSRKKELSQRVPTMKSKRFNSRHISLNEVTESQSRNVVETDTGLRKINQYKFNSVIGRGSFGEVWLATDDHNISYAIKVLKRSMLRKKRTGMASNALDAVLREVAVLKKVRHPHAVQLFEIIDDGKGDRLFLVMELLCGGEVMADANLPAGESHLPEHLARGVFRDLILGLEYLHVNGVLHRDIKPENIVYETAPRFGQGATTPRGSSSRAFSAVSRVLSSSRGDRSSSSKRSTLGVPPSPGGGSLAEKSLRDTPPIAEGSSNTNLAESSASGSKTPRGSKGRKSDDERPTPCAKLVDFGVAQMCELIEHPRTEGKYKTDDSVLKSAGTPAFYAPEMCVKGAYHGKAADVWACGITLCLLVGGKLPFDADNMPDIFEKIKGAPPELPPSISAELAALLHKILEKAPEKRITLAGLRDDPWVTNGGQLPPLAPPSAPVQVSDDDVAHAIKSLGAAITVLKAKTKFKGLLDAARFASAMEVDNMLHHEPGSAAAHEDEAQAIEAATAVADAEADEAAAAAGGSSAAEPTSPGSAYSANYEGSPGADRI